ncbi:MAG TPA: sulfite exporter TauE/SafE family protein [Ottowia sp.]|uniref:sulfite exporter TauE/SafE family protein n=1 Tax=Ottowia sp. TaxID=1898956 RepID=UPI001DD71C0C|nr:sulfite exporter TauE/SafE family protein [Ottowia sp.]MCP5257614.1 sulfite exporter TauE/SafE family protein [Burkholderiaceae bacterium]MCB2024821.1 sulfite exporter TauE/SafE family protein [Ottowia sp.]MCB2034801.1 sulfite exporter TauE/SafE family protein [Ottowia sp.]HPK31205.1 sulfite exporter TauE/SafE family protein [Ottowia sp.]HRW72789.1 sulfite exporter TauE/SafE family protein [Ottowia sp.]
MQASLAFTAVLMGLAGGPHCIAMCGAACAGIGQAAGERRGAALALFQLGRVVGYALLGALAAASMQGLGWLTVHSAALRPVWTMVHVAAAVIGLVLLIQARQPLWLETGARRIWARVRGATQRWGLAAPLGIGVAWALLPCGLLYSALLVATLSGSWVEGALTMALFALGTSVAMTAGPWLLLRFGADVRGQWGVRLAGLALLVMSVWALWMGFAHDQAPWCAPAVG